MLLLTCFQRSTAFLDPDVVVVLLSHLDKSKVPNLDTLPPTAAFTDADDGNVTFHSQVVERAKTVLWGFKEVFWEGRCLDRDGKQHFTPVLLSSWFGVYRWIEYFFQAVIDMDLGDERFKLSFIQGSIHIFEGFSLIEEVHNVLANTPGAMKLLTQLWLLHQRFPLAKQFPNVILTNVLRGRKHHLDEMLEAVDGDAILLIEEILEPYRRFQTSPSAVLEDRVLAQIPVFHLFSERPKHKLCRELLINNGVRELIKAYLQCATNPFSKKSQGFIAHAPTVCFSFFGELWRSSPGHAWVIQAFKAGLLEMFVRSWAFVPLLSAEGKESVNEGFLDFVMKYLVILPVLQAASAAILEVQSKLDMETRTRLAPSPSGDAWRKFENLVKDLERTADGLIDSRLVKYQLICDFVSLSLADLRH